MKDELVEKVARAIALADERNGAPPYEHRMAMGKHVRMLLYDEAEAAVEVVRKLLLEPDAMLRRWLEKTLQGEQVGDPRLDPDVEVRRHRDAMLARQGLKPGDKP